MRGEGLTRFEMEPNLLVSVGGAAVPACSACRFWWWRMWRASVGNRID
jgi:hypothetical protein